MDFVYFHKRNCCLVDNMYNIDLWLKGATVGGTEVLLDSSPRAFFQKLEEMEGLIAFSDLSWVNRTCNFFLGRDYKQPTFKDKGGDSRKDAESSPKEIEAFRMASLKNDRASVRR